MDVLGEIATTQSGDARVACWRRITVITTPVQGGGGGGLCQKLPAHFRLLDTSSELAMMF